MCDACACKVPRKGVYAELKDCRLQEEGGKVLEVDWWWWWWWGRVNQLTVLCWLGLFIQVCYLQALGNLQSLLQLFALLLLQ